MQTIPLCPAVALGLALTLGAAPAAPVPSHLMKNDAERMREWSQGK